MGCDAGTSNLGRCFAFGVCGVEKNISLGVSLFERAAQNGFASAQRCLGYVYEKGLGVACDLSKAFYWCECAAKQGNLEAEYSLGVYYAYGMGVPQNYEKALIHFKHTAENGYIESWRALGITYEKIGDLYEACKCYEKAIELGLENAKESYERVSNQIWEDAYNQMSCKDEKNDSANS